jgi:hypothetical protein
MPQPTYTLTQYMIIQIQIREVVDNEVFRRTPLVMQTIFKHFEVMLEINHTSKRKVLSSFYDVDNNSVFDTPWDDALEQKLENAKKEINEGSFKLNKETDLRIMAQLVLDFFESLKEPTISRTTVSHLSNQVHTGMSSQEILHDQLEGGYIVPRDPTKVDYSNNAENQQIRVGSVG